MDPADITAQIVEAWDEVVAEDEAEQAALRAETGVVEPPSPEEETEEPNEGDEEEQDDDAAADVGDEDDDDEQGEEEDDEGDEVEQGDESAYETDDITVKAFLAKYDGNVEKALKAAADLTAVLGRQGLENGNLKSQVEDLQAENDRLRLVSQGVAPLTQEQQDWIENALTSGQPARFVQAAVDQREWELAKALCAAWGQDDPYNARRIADQVEQREYEDANQPPPQVDLGLLVKTMQERDPSMMPYARSAAEMINRLGDDHRIVQALQSGDLGTMIQAVQEVYELAKFSSVAVTEAREKVVAKQRQDATEAKRNGVVSSGAATPGSTETPRRNSQLMPGLTLEALEEAFASQ